MSGLLEAMYQFDPDNASYYATHLTERCAHSTGSSHNFDRNDSFDGFFADKHLRCFTFLLQLSAYHEVADLIPAVRNPACVGFHKMVSSYHPDLVLHQFLIRMSSTRTRIDH